MAAPIALAWTNIQTTGLPTGADFSDVHILEIAMVFTDFDLNPLTGESSVLRLTKSGALELRKSPDLLATHKESNLLQEAAEATASTQDVEDAIIAAIQEETSLSKGEIILAGTGTDRFILPLLSEKMPVLSSWFPFYTADLGVFRRMSHIFAHGPIINPSTNSIGKGKPTRALDAVNAMLDEARQYQSYFQEKS